jgi:energy-coupling factor transporter ATP-binding protein EcfA2
MHRITLSGEVRVLIRFRVENHRSIRHEQEFSMVASGLTDRPESLVRVDRYDMDLLRVAAVYGPNASGKSTLIDALSFMQEAVQDSQRLWKPGGEIPRVAFALDAAWAAKPSTFVVDLLIDGVRHEYGFVVDSTRVLEEWLYVYPKGRRQEWFTRDVHRKEEFAFSRLMPGENRAIRSLTRPNSLFLSAAAQNNHQALAPLYEWFSKLEIVDEATRSILLDTMAEECADEEHREGVLEMLRMADLGISDIEVLEHSPPRKWIESYTLHDAVPRHEVRLYHRTGEEGPDIALPFGDESGGTRALFGLAGPVMDALVTGGVVVIDEFDQSLHTHLAMGIVRVFNDPASNPKNAQLIFNTHDTNLLDGEILRRDQVWFTEKGGDGATHLFPLTDFHARKSENLERGYLQGRYGAVPSISAPYFPRNVLPAAEG